MKIDPGEYDVIFQCPLVYITFGLFIVSLIGSLFWEQGKFIAMVCGLAFTGSIVIYIIGGGYKWKKNYTLNM